uniref:Uncharacterized protein n=1 Tax=Aegilops tauschii subsp. strangulata TaxID=200361 RepID=A0A453NKG6_AEGTS
ARIPVRHLEGSTRARPRVAMEIESNTKQCRVKGAPSEEDRLSGLPDDVLHSIVGRVPLKQAVRTSALSTRWPCLWLHALAASAVLDFTDREFARGQSLGRIVATVNRCLEAHGAAPLDVFRVALSPFDAFGRDVVRWAAAALGRGAREVGVDLTQHADGRGALELPADLFQAESSLAVLSLGRCSLRDVPPGTAGLAGLTSLSLNQVDVTDDAVRDVVSGCRLLEFLSLESCHLLVSVRVAGERLRGLEIVRCLAMRHLQVAAPVLESVVYHGDVLLIWREDEPSGVEFVGPGGRTDARPELKDAYLTHIGYGVYDEVIHEFAYSGFLDQVAHAKILTLCSVGMLVRYSNLFLPRKPIRRLTVSFIRSAPGRRAIVRGGRRGCPEPRRAAAANGLRLHGRRRCYSLLRILRACRGAAPRAPLYPAPRRVRRHGGDRRGRGHRSRVRDRSRPPDVPQGGELPRDEVRAAAAKVRPAQGSCPRAAGARHPGRRRNSGAP